MAVAVVSQPTPSIEKALRGLSAEHRQIIQDCYNRLLPVLLILMRWHDIYERNRAWPGTSPTGKVATTWIAPSHAKQARDVIDAYASQVGEQKDQLWQLFYAYCRYGPIGLIDTLPEDIPSIIPQQLQEFATFHRLAKHPRSDAGIYIRELLDSYADDLSYPRLPAFVARYAFIEERRIERWFFPEGKETEYVTKTTRRLNLANQYPHHRWLTGIIHVPVTCRLAQRHQQLIQPWLIWMAEDQTSTLMGFRLCPDPPTIRDILLTLRWSIWHYDAPWWNARGAPDELVVPVTVPELDVLASKSLRYLRVALHSADLTEIQQPDAESDTIALPPLLNTVLDSVQLRQRVNDDLAQLTLADIHELLLDLLHEQQQHTFAVSTAIELREQRVSLPWSDSVGAAGLLPAMGMFTVANDMVIVHGIPYDLPSASFADGSVVMVRFDPDDARRIAIVHGQAHVVIAHPAAFEHHLSWCELSDDLSLIK